jgi:hypothetical protein
VPTCAAATGRLPNGTCRAGPHVYQCNAAPGNPSGQVVQHGSNMSQDWSNTGQTLVKHWSKRGQGPHEDRCDAAPVHPSGAAKPGLFDHYSIAPRPRLTSVWPLFDHSLATLWPLSDHSLGKSGQRVVKQRSRVLKEWSNRGQRVDLCLTTL